jgi:hypothetical protein
MNSYLLDDFSFGDLDNLCVNSKVSDRFKPFIPGMDDLFLEVLVAPTGTNLDSNSSDEMNFLIPLIFYADKTGTDNQDTLRALAFTLALFRRHIRENPDAWRYGFIPDLHTIPQRDVGPRENGSLSSLP